VKRRRPSLAPIKMQMKGVATRAMGLACAKRPVVGRTRQSRDTRVYRPDLCLGQIIVHGPPGAVAS
jgi:hypothetical protein